MAYDAPSSDATGTLALVSNNCKLSAMTVKLSFGMERREYECVVRIRGYLCPSRTLQCLSWRLDTCWQSSQFPFLCGKL
jgi:hypothetical protein